MPSVLLPWFVSGLPALIKIVIELKGAQCAGSAEDHMAHQAAKQQRRVAQPSITHFHG